MLRLSATEHAVLLSQFAIATPVRGGRRQLHDEAIAAILSAIRQLTNPPPPKRRPIGFTADLDEKS